MATIRRTCGRLRLGDAHGIAELLVIYGLAVFSVLAFTMVTDPELARKFRTASDSDLHVVLFGGRADSTKIVSRLNIPTALRAAEKTDFGVEVEIPLPMESDVTTELGAGSTYSVRLSSDMRVCCDTGDNACANLPPDSDAPLGSVNRTIPASKTPIPEASVSFDLSTLPTPKDLPLDPAVVGGDHFLVKAAKDQSADPALTLQDRNLACRVERNGTTLATGTLSLRATAGPPEQVGPFTGKLQLKYGSPAPSDR